jgi:SMI1 / KNR4 family (SUKH-1)
MSALKQLFPEGKFGPPASEESIIAAENELGVRLPEVLRSLYRECDGFREPLGNCKYLLSLLDEDSIGSVVSMTKFYWTELPIIAEGVCPDLKPFIFFGTSHVNWAIRIKQPHLLIAYHYHMLDRFEVVGYDILQLYQDEHVRFGADDRHQTPPTQATVRSMPLRLRRAAEHYGNPTCWRDEDHVVISGEAVIGGISRLVEGQYQGGKWAWAVSVPIRNTKLPYQDGVADDLETAKQNVAEGFRAWLDWAGLQEK